MIKCTYENGGHAYLRHVVVDGVIVENNQIMLVKRSPTAPVEPGKYALPGGYMELDESADDSVLREVLEETGYQASIQDLFLIIHTPRTKGDDRQNVGFVYTLKLGEKLQDSDHEISHTKWFDLDALPPSKNIGFDHADIIDFYLTHQNSKQPLPFINLDSDRQL